MENDNFTLDIELKRLMQGAEIPIDKVYQEICPGCAFKTGFCEIRMAISLENAEIGFVCRGMRAYVAKSN